MLRVSRIALRSKGATMRMSTVVNGIVMPGPATKDLECNTIVDMFVKTSKLHASRPLFGTRNGDKFNWMTYKEFEDEVTKFRTVLHKLNFGVNDKVAVIVNNRYL